MSGRTGSFDSSPVPARWLGLAATPTFALMACMTAVGSSDISLCSVTPAFFPINEMAFMYVLMSVFHLSPWLKLISARLRFSHILTTQRPGD